MMFSAFSIYNYHWIWYILGFFCAPRLTLAILLCVYVPIGLIWKILAVVLSGSVTFKRA